MDFTVAAPGGVAAGNAAALAARGADPAITIPGGNHFFRRITGLVLAPIPGALVAYEDFCDGEVPKRLACVIFSTKKCRQALMRRRPTALDG